MQTQASILEQENYPSGWKVFSRLFLLASAMVALSYGLITATVAVHKWIS